MARCERLVVAGTRELGLKRLVVLGWGLAVALVCWELADLRSGLEVPGPRWPEWSEGPLPGYVAGAESAGSAAGEPSSQRISAAPCGRTDGQPAVAAAGTPTAQRQTDMSMI